MTSRECVQAVLKGEVPEAVPRALYDVAINTYNQSTLDLFQKMLGRHPRDCFRQDLRGVHVQGPPQDTDWRRRVRDVATPEAARAALRPWVEHQPDIEGLRRQVAEIHRAGCAAVAVGWISDFETPFGLRGREQFFIDIAEEAEWLPVFLDGIAQAAANSARAAGLAGADIFGIGDDLGSQRGLLISPGHWRRLFKPRLKSIIAALKDANPETAFFLHTDGLVTELVPDFIEVGVDILNPVQPEVMDLPSLKREYGDELVFFGGISVQYTLPFGTPRDVYNEVKERMETIGAGGGYLMTPSHLVNADIPWENIVAFFDAAERYGRSAR
ncbi:MAG: hypothetical protein HY321_19645 [Armatimonadetes bacterium]|nr:hypothetical protein [Armatimonadota bacterium]